MEERQPEVAERRAKLPEVVRQLLELGEAEQAASTLASLHAADGARLLAELEPEDRQSVVAHLGPQQIAGLLEQLDTADAVALSVGLDGPDLSTILDLTSPDVAADVLHRLPSEQAQAILEGMAHAQEVSSLLPYGDESAGGLMVPDFVVLQEWMTAQEAIANLRGTKPRSESSNYLFVLDWRNRLSGVVGLRDLVLAPAQTRVRDLMDPQVITVGPGTDQEECARIMQRYDIVQLPVADAERQVLGVILEEDILDVIEQEATEDMLRLAGISESERIISPFGRAFRARLPWMLVNLATVMMAAAIINIFESTIAGAVFLVVFLPMVASQGGVAGSQTLTLVTRGLALGELSFRNARRALAKEVALGLTNGAVTGVIAGALAYAWKGSATLGLVVGVAMALNLLVAALFGTLVPLALKALRQDPALGSVVILTTLTDMAGFGFLLGLAAWWLAR